MREIDLWPLPTGVRKFTPTPHALTAGAVIQIVMLSQWARLNLHEWTIRFALVLSIWVLTPFAAENVRADDSFPTGIPDPSIATSLPPDLADPGGIRRALAGRGITYGAHYIGEYFGVTSGGLNQDSHYDGQLELLLDVDMERLIGWKGLSFHANGYQIHGTSISAESLGSLMPVSFIEATPATRLLELWLEQSFLDGLISIRAGQLAADSEFILSEGGGSFINATWGWPSITADNLPNGGPAYPLPTPGIRVALYPNENLGFLVGVFNGDVVDYCPPDEDPQRCNNHGLDFPFGDGTLVMAEAAIKYTQGLGQLPGTVKVGGWHHNGDFADQRDPAVTYEDNHGLYAIWDQMLVRLPGDDRNIAIFARVIGSPSDRNQVDFYAEGGVTVTGLFASRPGDVLGIGYAYTGISEDAGAFDRDEGLSVIRDYEAVLEISYTAEIVPGWTLQPDFQYFWHPGGNVPDESGTRAVENAVVFGLRSSVNY